MQSESNSLPSAFTSRGTMQKFIEFEIGFWII